MKCNNCNHQNPNGSIFCEECGSKLVASRENRSSRIEEELSDVIFTPKKNKRRIWVVIFGLFTLAFLLFAYLVIDSSYSGSSPETFTTTQTSPLSNLVLESFDSDWRGNIFYITGVVRNHNSTPVINTLVRIDFYRDEELNELFDTRYVVIDAIIADNGAYSFSEPIYDFTGIEYFYYLANIEEAEYL